METENTLIRKYGFIEGLLWKLLWKLEDYRFAYSERQWEKTNGHVRTAGRFERSLDGFTFWLERKLDAHSLKCWEEMYS